MRMSLLMLLYLAPVGLRTKYKCDSSWRPTVCLVPSFFSLIPYSTDAFR